VNRRAKTAAALARVATKKALEQMVVLIKDPEDKPQQAASKAFGTLGAKAMPSLIEVFKSPDLRAKKAAVKSCGMIGGEAIAALSKALAVSEAREFSAIALGEVRLKALEKAKRAEGEERDELLRVAEDATQPLLKAAQAKDKDLRRIAITVLGEVKEKRGVPYALKDLKVASNTRAAIIALGLIADSRATEAVIPFLDEDKYKIEAATALGKIGDARAAPPLLEKLKDPETQFAGRAVWALRRIGKGAVPYLAPALKSANLPQRRAAAEAFYGIHDPGSVAPLVGALSDPDEAVRVAAARALGWKGNAGAMNALLAVLAGASWRVSDAAIESLAEIGEPAVRPLIEKLKTGDAAVAYAASAALARMAQIGQASPTQALLAALSGPDASARKWSAVTLGDIGDRETTGALEAYLKSASSKEEKWVATEALRKLGVSTPSM
jgi:HEAT repeat protein